MNPAIQVYAHAANRIPCAPSGRTGILQRKCACGGATGPTGECESCRKKREKGLVQRKSLSSDFIGDVPTVVGEVLGATGRALDDPTRKTMESSFGQDFSRVRLHTDNRAAASARAIHALAYTVGHNIVFDSGQYAPHTLEGRQLLAHELTHVVQQGAERAAHPLRMEPDTPSAAERQADAVANRVVAGQDAGPIVSSGVTIQKRAAPFIDKVTVHLEPLQSAELHWNGTPPADAPGSDRFQVSTGKGYSDPGDDPGTCTRDCCSDPLTQCAPPWNQPGKVGACCTFHGNNFWTGTPLPEHNTWKWWTPIEPYYSSRGIALHQHPKVNGQPIGHGCVRMDEANARRIHDFSNGRQTNVTIDGRAAPVLCDDTRKCGAKKGAGTAPKEIPWGAKTAAATSTARPGQEGMLS